MRLEHLAIMKPIAFLLLVLLVDHLTAQEPDWLWARNGIGDSHDYTNAITTDASGNVFLAGYFGSDSITFGNFTLQNSTPGESDLFLVKYDPAGTVLWAYSTGSTWDDEVDAIATDALGNVYITGNFYSPTLTFGTTTLTNAGNVGDIFVAKFSPDGDVLMALRDGGPGLEIPHGIAVDDLGSIVVTGRFSSNSVTFGTTTLLLAGSMDVFVVKYGSEGAVLWAKGAGGGSNDEAEAVAIDSNGDIIVTGYYTQQSTFGTFILPNPGLANVFIAKCDGADGTFEWVKWFASDGVEEPNAVALDAQDNIYVAGHFQTDSITFGSTTLYSTGSDNGFVARFDDDGDPIWAHGLNARARAEGIVVSNNAVYACGTFHENGYTYGSSSLDVEGTADLYVLKSDLNGNAQWVVKQTSEGESSELATCLAADVTGHIVLGGNFNSDVVNFGAVELVVSDGWDPFVIRMGDPDVGIADEQARDGISIHPNPGSGMITIEGLAGMRTIEVCDGLGALQLLTNVPAMQQRIVLQLPALAPGLYHLRLSNGSRTVLKKFVVDGAVR